VIAIKSESKRNINKLFAHFIDCELNELHFITWGVCEHIKSFCKSMWYRLCNYLSGQVILLFKWKEM